MVTSLSVLLLYTELWKLNLLKFHYLVNQVWTFIIRACNVRQRAVWCQVFTNIDNSSVCNLGEIKSFAAVLYSYDHCDLCALGMWAASASLLSLCDSSTHRVFSRTGYRHPPLPLSSLRPVYDKVVELSTLVKAWHVTNPPNIIIACARHGVKPAVVKHCCYF